MFVQSYTQLEVTRFTKHYRHYYWNISTQRKIGSVFIKLIITAVKARNKKTAVKLFKCTSSLKNTQNTVKSTTVTTYDHCHRSKSMINVQYINSLYLISE